MVPKHAQLVRTPPSCDFHEPGVRWLGRGDGPALVELVRACYGDTYSYRDLYDPAAIEARWVAGTMLSLGHLDAHGQLDGHTAFLRKDPKHEYVESALSLIRPGARRGFAVDPGPLWRALLSGWAQEVSFIHQNTTTRHTRSQLYAARYMRARATGWVFDYALGEALVGLAEDPAPMHALTMSTSLVPPVSPTLAVPMGPWQGWLKTLVRGVLPNATVEPISCADAGGPVAFNLAEDNPSLGLQRHVIELSSVLTRVAPPEPRLAPRPRLDLVHLPMRASLVRLAWADLCARGYLPVGIRPHRDRDSEIVLQRTDSDRGRVALAEMALAGAKLRDLGREWLEACALTS